MTTLLTSPVDMTERQRLTRALSNIHPFIEQRCDLGDEFRVSIKELHTQYNSFQIENEDYMVSGEIFDALLRTACPTVRVSDPWEGGKRSRYYRGIRLKDFTVS